MGQSSTQYDIIYADPPWRYDFSRSDSRRVENHYPTMTLEAIRALEIPAAPDSVLFLWATAPKLPQALSVMGAWRFEYITNLVWDKMKIGMGYWARGRHEHLLIGRRGNFQPPPASSRRASIFECERGRHSEKPWQIRAWISLTWPEARKLEMFARQKTEGWDVHGLGVDEPREDSE